MLTDIERKVLRIISNFSAIRKRMPNIHELEIKTGRSRDGIMDVLAVLAVERYIEWSSADPERIVLLEDWERKPILGSGWKAYGKN